MTKKMKFSSNEPLNKWAAGLHRQEHHRISTRARARERLTPASIGAPKKLHSPGGKQNGVGWLVVKVQGPNRCSARLTTAQVQYKSVAVGQPTVGY